MSTASLTRDQLSELRIRNNRIRREKELKRNLILLVLTIVILFTILFVVTSSKSVASSGETQFKYYTDVTVKTGDTLSSIVSQYVDDNHSYKELVKEVIFTNHIKDPDNIKAGTVLVIPYYDSLK
ncbi:MAG: LysM peptidoglycan-binding domain-containing protein [Firmicutes bacterium]|nr:LysM peptidoglycan-binding domain-containing protein [Candidatus Colivicinus equi]